jgi:hypothetical protein
MKMTRHRTIVAVAAAVGLAGVLAGLAAGRLLWQWHQAPSRLSEIRASGRELEVVVTTDDGTHIGFTTDALLTGTGRSLTLKAGAFVVVGSSGRLAAWLRQGPVRETMLDTLRVRRPGLWATSAWLTVRSGTAKEDTTIGVSRILHAAPRVQPTTRRRPAGGPHDDPKSALIDSDRHPGA